MGTYKSDDIIIRCKKGDKNAFGMLMREHQNMVFSLALFMFKVDYNIRMPQGNMLSRQLKGTQLIVSGFSVNPCSSVSHPWAYIITISILLASVTGLIIIRKRKYYCDGVSKFTTDYADFSLDKDYKAK